MYTTYPRVIPVRPRQGAKNGLCCTSCLLCQNEAFCLGWKGVIGNGEFTAAAPAKNMARAYIKACLFVFLLIASGIFLLHPQRRLYPDLYPPTKAHTPSLFTSESSTSLLSLPSLSTNESSISLSIHQQKLYLHHETHYSLYIPGSTHATSNLIGEALSSKG